MANQLRAIVLFLAFFAISGTYAASCPSPDATSQPIKWNRDAEWNRLEARFIQIRQAGCPNQNGARQVRQLSEILDRIHGQTLADDNPLWDELQEQLYETTVEVAACTELAIDYARQYRRLHQEVKEQSRTWDTASLAARKRIYHLLYGARTGLEEIMVQMDTPWSADFVDIISAPNTNDSVVSATPGAEFEGITLHSGDMLVSRGGAPASAIIARGQDRPGNFSHVAQVYVSDQPIDKQQTAYPRIRLIEAHIEIGVAVSTVETYLKDTKQRLMLIRPRADLPIIKGNPMLPDQAAAFAHHRAITEYIPYDFEMNYLDDSRLFCSEVASDAYHEFGLNLWEDPSTITGPGISRWLGDFGVRCFEIQEPSDLEYDPHMAVVAEWRSAEALMNDRISSAVVDAMIEQADAGEKLSYNRLLLPLGWILKGYSGIKNLFKKAGPIPQGMNTKAALKNLWYTSTHKKFAARLSDRAQAFKEENNYEAPYWRLVDMARDIVRSH